MNKTVNIAIIGKYVNLKDAYKSLDEALTHGGIQNKVKINLIRIESDKLKSNNIRKKLKNISGILIPGGFGKRGTEGKIACIKYAREKKIPFLGICFGMQMAVIEFARNVLNIKNCFSTFTKPPDFYAEPWKLRRSLNSSDIEIMNDCLDIKMLNYNNTDAKVFSTFIFLLTCP